MKPTERFSNRAEDYRLHRPGYPVAVTDLMRDVCGLQPGAAVADVGAGTGIFTRVLLEAGFEVSAVEPNEAMRLAAEEDLRGFARFHPVAGTAEETGLPGAAFDAVTMAQAFHWFDHVAARAEFVRLLRPGGWVFIVGNERRMDKSPFARDYEELLLSLGEVYRRAPHRAPGMAEQRHGEFFSGCAVQVAKFDNPHVMDWPALRGRFLSSSYSPAKDDARHEEYLRRLEGIFHRHAVDGRVVFRQTTGVAYAQMGKCKVES